MTSAPTAIDLSRLPAPTAIEPLSFDVLLQGAIDRFVADYASARALDPSLPAYSVEMLQTDPVIIELRTWSNLRLYDRQRVNDVFEALLAARARGSNLDAIAAGRNIERQTIVAATSTAAAIMESDTGLLRRYLLSFDVPAAGSAGRYLFDAWTAWPHVSDVSGMLDARVNGYAVHGRRGDIDLVITGPGGAVPTTEQILTVRNAVTDINRAPEGVAITVLGAVRVEYAVSLVVEVPQFGPAPELIRQEALARVNAAAKDRLLIGGEIPAGFLAGAAYGPNIIKVRDLAPVLIEPDPYKIPVMTAVEVTVEVR
ncbi:baseplate J/gp47 family protein [Agrobacterium sp. MS2]|uniref:baseplate J/gp47 family protein n=1 Tax=Agrobacterium sp. MS2 TaxID=1345498 RepID=UPI000DB0DE58|nr:baseplate J/gp47 family protein [Agrobacterium sp. MS2]PZP72859.1 MAG: baseplate assembly protein [Delftia acidovorans]RAL95607.1 baseplate assembly protein [Agrobacterium sp. MS2]